MSTEDNKAVVRRYVEELQNNGDLDVADEIIHPNPRNPRSVSMWSNGPESVKQTVSGVRKSFPDLHRQIDDMVAEGDKVVLYSTISGTYAGPSEGYPFLVWKDEKINMTVVATFMVEDGKMIEEPWSK